MADYVIDTSAILAVLKQEDGFEAAHALLRQAERPDTGVKVNVPFVALMEVEYQLLRELRQREVERWLNIVLAWPTEVVESNEAWRRVAAAIKSAGKVSFADALVAALALMRDATLVHKDPEFDGVNDLRHLRLPYDRDVRTSP